MDPYETSRDSAALSASKRFITDNEDKQQQFTARDKQRHSVSTSRSQTGHALIVAQQEAQRRTEVLGALDQIRQGVVGLTKNLENLDDLSKFVPNPPVLTFSSETVSYSLMNDPKVRAKVTELLLADDKILLNIKHNISQLQHQKATFKGEGTSETEYKAMCEKEDSLLKSTLGSEALSSGTLHKHRQDRDSYQIWKEKIERKNQQALANLDQQISKAQIEYSKERTASEKALTNYSSAYNRKYEQLVAAKLDDEQISRHMELSFPKEIEFIRAHNEKVSLAFAKSITHQYAAEYKELLTTGASPKSDGWNNLEYFYTNPLPIECFSMNLAISDDVATKMQTLSLAGPNPWIQLGVDAGKLCIVKYSERGGTAVSIIVELALDRAEAAVHNLPQMKVDAFTDKLDKLLEVHSNVIPRVAGTNGANLQNMYSALNATLQDMATDPTTDKKVATLLSNRIKKNNKIMQEQLAGIREYQRTHSVAAHSPRAFT